MNQTNMYTIKTLERKTSAKGTSYIKASFESGQSNVSIFDRFPNFSSLKEGDQVEGDLTKSDYKGKEGWVLNTLNKPYSGGKGNMAKAVEAKSKAIEHAQDRKEMSIKAAGVMRDATLLTVAYLGNRKDIMEMSEIQRTWQEWRKWLEGQSEVPF